MPSVVSVPLRRVFAGFAAALLALGVVLVTSPAASAHDVLLETSPAADSEVETLPAEVTLTFSAHPIDGEGATLVEISSADGASVVAGEPVLSDAMVTVPLVSEAPAGEYEVLWKVVSSDGHPISGAFTFTVLTGTEAVEVSPVPTAEPTTEPTHVPGEGTPADGDAFVRNLPWIIGIGAFVILGGALLAVLVARARRGGSAASDAPSER